MECLLDGAEVDSRSKLFDGAITDESRVEHASLSRKIERSRSEIGAVISVTKISKKTK